MTDSPTASYDVAVVGAGHHGLTAATLLAQAGLSVVVLDRLDRPGGAAATTQPWSGRSARVSRWPGPVPPFPQRLAEELDLRLDVVAPPADPPTPTPLDALAAAVEATLLDPLPSTRSLPPVPGTEPLSGLAALDALAGSPGPAVANPSALRAALAGGADRWPQVVGGGAAVADALAAAATRAGAELRLGGGVSAVRTGADEAPHEVDADFASGRETIGARWVLADLAPWILHILLGEPEDAESKPQGSRFVVDLLVDRLPRRVLELQGARLVVAADAASLAAAYDDARSGRLPRRPPGALHSPSLRDPSLVAGEPDGTHTLTWVGVHHPVHLFDPDPRERREEALRHVLAVLDDTLGESVEGLLARDAAGHPCAEARSPLDLEAEFAAPGGHPFHGDLDWPWAPPRARLDTPELAWGVATGHPRVLLAGSGARRGGTLSGVAGRDAAQAVLASP
ncbi:NAD(P)-binding protein [Nocardioides flavescens]|uniref:NAD(P)-binding protein n=1 Tax=Nocardioides flavescens TaxID=2691959 RepID=A0A6L7ERY8_9ACTN|nr:NAD(P)-binding protein [Nocardioides flavescens]